MTIIFLFPVSAWAGEICFNSAVAGKIVVQLEQDKVNNQILDVQKEINKNLQNQLIEYNKEVEEYKHTVKELQQVIANQKDLNEKQEKLCAAANPVSTKILIGTGALGIGILLGILL